MFFYVNPDEHIAAYAPQKHIFFQVIKGKEIQRDEYRSTITHLI